MRAARETNLKHLVVAGGVGANRRLQERLADEALAAGITVFRPPLEFCTDNGAMVAFAAALRIAAGECSLQRAGAGSFSVKPRWDLDRIRNTANGT
jgi:N6-L-threonylcarbamoyladenine synthase